MDTTSSWRSLFNVASIGSAIGVLACSSGGGGDIRGAAGSATVSGTVLGNAFTARDAVSYSGDVAIVDFAGLCAFGLAHAKASAKYLRFTFAGGTFPIGKTDVGAALDVRAEIEDSKCNSVAPVAGGGSVTLTQVDASGVVGTFDVTLATDHLTGAFNAHSCTMPGGSTCN